MSAPSGPAAWVAAADVADTSGCLNVTFAGLPEPTWLQLKAEADFKGVTLTKTITMNVGKSDDIDLIKSKIWATTGIQTSLCLLTFFPQKTVLQDHIQFRWLRADPCTLHAHTKATAETAVEAVGPEVPLSQHEMSTHDNSDVDSDYSSGAAHPVVIAGHTGHGTVACHVPDAEVEPWCETRNQILREMACEEEAKWAYDSPYSDTERDMCNQGKDHPDNEWKQSRILRFIHGKAIPSA